MQEKAQNLAQKGKKHKRAEKNRTEQVKEAEDNEAFISDEAYSFWEKNLSDKGFIGERGFGTFISPFVEKKKRVRVCSASTNHLGLL